jgi:hypothetical protein
MTADEVRGFCLSVGGHPFFRLHSLDPDHARG